MRRGLPYASALTSAWTSTRIGRDPSTQHSTADPGVPNARSDRNSFEDRQGAGRQPSFRRHPALRRRTGFSADHPMRVMTLALEIQDRVDNVLEHLGTGKAAVLRHMADENDLGRSSPFAANRNCVAASRTCPMLPGAD